MSEIPANFRIKAEMAACYVENVNLMWARRNFYQEKFHENLAALHAGQTMIFCMNLYHSFVPKPALMAYKTIAMKYIEARRNYEKAAKAIKSLFESGHYITNIKTAELYLSDAIGA